MIIFINELVFFFPRRGESCFSAEDDAWERFRRVGRGVGGKTGVENRRVSCMWLGVG